MPTYMSSMARGLLGKESSNGLKHNRSFALRNADVVILAGVVCDFRLDYGKTVRYVTILNYVTSLSPAQRLI